MDQTRFYEWIEVPAEVQQLLKDYEMRRTGSVPDELIDRFYSRETWDAAVRDLEQRIGQDPDGMGALWEILEIIRTVTLPEYEKRGIPDAVFVDTMKFVRRTLLEQKEQSGIWTFPKAWWIPRQMALVEFRIGQLEFEFIEAGEQEEKKREIAIHIPSDADLSDVALDKSFTLFEAFQRRFYPGWEQVPYTCHSWMMHPLLGELVGENSRLAGFQKRFVIDALEPDATWYMEWIFPENKESDPVEKLPEKTSLQRALKKLLLGGKKFGVAKGHIDR